MTLTFETEREADGRWIAEVIELPGVLAYGQTREQAMQMAEFLAQEVLDHNDYCHSETSGNHLTLPMSGVVQQIFCINSKIHCEFGQQVNVFLHSNAKKGVQEARFDRQVSLSRTLRKWLKSDLAEGDLILAWANLGALLEGTLKAFLTVYFADYEKDIQNHSSANAIHRKGSKKGNLKHPGQLRLEDLITYFRNQKLFTDTEIELAKRIQGNRNAIHAFLDSTLDNNEEFQLSLRLYLALQRKLYGQMPG
jgi:predicted RNase H-like HicB family nuclease